MKRLGAKEEIAALYMRTAKQRSPAGPIGALEEIGISGEAFTDWNAEDVLDTISDLYGKRIDTGQILLDVAELAAVIATHADLAFQAGYQWAEEREA